MRIYLIVPNYTVKIVEAKDESNDETSVQKDESADEKAE